MNNTHAIQNAAPAQTTSLVRVRRVSKYFGEFRALNESPA
jgi:hypothetical protein